MFYAILYGYQTKSNVHLLYSFIHVFTYNSIPKLLPNLWQRRLEKPLLLFFDITFVVICFLLILYFDL